LKEFSFQVEVIPTPGATKSGFTLPSSVGPLLLQLGTLSLSSTAPTVIPFFEQPGEVIVPVSGPEFPAATTTTTTTPLFTALSTALDLGLDENMQGAGRIDAYKAYVYVTNTTKEPENETENKTKKIPPGFEKRKEIELPLAFERGLPAAGITPDSWTYGFKRFFEDIDLFFTFDDVVKAEKHGKYAELRLAEAKEMIEKGKPEFVDDLIEEYEDNLEKANEISKIAQRVGKNVTKVTEVVAVATSIHMDVLENVLEKVPEQAKPSIQRAITSSKRGNEEALKVLEKAQPEKAAEVQFKNSNIDILSSCISFPNFVCLNLWNTFIKN